MIFLTSVQKSAPKATDITGSPRYLPWTGKPWSRYFMQFRSQVVGVVFSVIFFSLPAIAQEALFQALPSHRSVNIQQEEATIHLGDYIINGDMNLHNFSFELPSIRTNEAPSQFRSLSMQRRSLSPSQENGTGVFFDDNGFAGDYVATKVGETLHALFRRVNENGDIDHIVLRSNSRGTHSMHLELHDHKPGCGHDSHNTEIEAVTEEDSLSTLAEVTATDSTTEMYLDVLVLITPEALDYAGGEDAARAMAEQAITLSNESYDNSNVNLTLSLANVAFATDSESEDFGDDLGRLAADGDGFFDEVHGESGLRDTYYADMVVLLRSPGKYCGIGYSPSSIAALESGLYAFSVVAANCIDYYSFQHEIGHNLGLQHDVDNAPSNTAYDAPYGHRWTTEQGSTYRSVMAYSPGTRVPYFSNPDVNHEGKATGAAGEANNSAVLRIVADYAQDYRDNPNPNRESGGETGGGETGGGSEETTPGGETGGGTETGPGEGSFEEVIVTLNAKNGKKRKKKGKRSNKKKFVVKIRDFSGAPLKGRTLELVQTIGSVESVIATGQSNKRGKRSFKVKQASPEATYFARDIGSEETSRSLSIRKRSSRRRR